MQTLKYGRKPPKNHPAIPFARIWTGAIPEHPAAVDYMTPLDAGWEMLGNDQYGDCVAVTWANERRIVTHYLSTENYPDQSQVFTFYKTQNPGFPNEDNGMDIQTGLEYLHDNGGPDGVKAVAFARVDHNNPEEVKAAIAIFGCVWVGINVLDANMQQFNDGQPWDYVAHSRLDGGHSVVAAGYGPPGSGALRGDIRFETWAEETSFTDSYWNHQVEECWVVIWPEHYGTKAFEEGIDQAELAAAYQELTDEPLPEPPAPTPVPPAPETPLEKFWDVAGEWIQHNRTRPDLKVLKAAIVEYGQAMNLL